MAQTSENQTGIWIIDADGLTSYVSERMAEILGASRSELLGQSSFDYIFPEDLPAAKRLFTAKKNGHIKSFEFRLQRKDGSAVLVEVQGTPLFSPDGAFQGVVGTFAVSLTTRERWRNLAAAHEIFDAGATRHELLPTQSASSSEFAPSHGSPHHFASERPPKNQLLPAS